MAVTNKYVKFLRGSYENWNKLAVKDPDTLYFISNPEDTTANLYFGDKLIVDNNVGTTITLSELEDFLLSEEIPANSLLVYDAVEGKWVDKTLAEIFSESIGAMTGATEEADGASGLVPAPVAGDQNKFLRGDGTWAAMAEISKDDIKEALEEMFENTEDDDNIIRKIAKEEVAKIVGEPEEDYNTLEKISNWIMAHEDTNPTFGMWEEWD